jgi:two-component system CheB/CheR fusion protein
MGRSKRDPRASRKRPPARREPAAAGETTARGSRAREATTADAQRTGPAAQGLPVVALGASAGGLEALEQFFAAAPRDGGLAYVVVQHLDRRHPSLLVELLARRTSMPVRQAVDGDALAANRIFVIPPNAQLAVSDGTLRVTPRGAEPAASIDTFFRSLSQDRGELAIGIILSGSGTDGTFGARAIREQGGLTLAQAPETAKHPSMPESAIAAGFIDEVLAVSAMPARVIEHLARIQGTRGSVTAEADVRESLDKVAYALRRGTGHDFGGYKQGTLVRRIRRRIQLLRIDSMAEYLRRLGEDPEEPGLLVKDLLIGVTQFFREPAAFDLLAEKVIAKLLEEKGAERPVRIWVPACATGEEAYSIAILVYEQLAALGTARPIQLFATDIDTEALAAARVGRYRADIAEQVSPERLARYFTRLDDGYQVVKELRDVCVFSAHNLIRDPPFSNLDLISCRNLLIYLEPELQKKVIPLLHYALRPSGFLFLGSSEELSGHTGLFEQLDKKQRIFRRKDPLVRPALQFPLSGPRASRGLALPTTVEPAARNPKQTVVQSFERMLLEEFAPASAVVDERGEMLCLGGRRGLLLQAPAGLVTNSILDHTEGTLRHSVRTALAEAVSNRAEVVGPELVTEMEGRSHRLRVRVRPAPGAPAQSGLFAVVLEDLGVARVSTAEDTAAAFAHEPMIENLERELKSTRADLQAANEELEGANEELKSSNEELISTNEELQSANEELQTSKEELQSVNEELETVNTELRQKVHELGVANSDLQNLFTSTQVATIFLDREHNLTKFTPAATTLFRFIEADIGRPLSDLAPRFAGTDLPADVNEVLRTLVPVEREIRAGDAWFILRVLPYRTLEDAIAGAVITFTDVTKLKRAEAALREGERLLKDVIDGSPSLVFLKDLQGRFLTVNKRLEALLGLTREQLKGKTDYDVFPREKAEYYREHDRQVAESKQPIAIEEGAELLDGHHVFLASKFPLFDSAGRIYGVGAISHDITERKRAEELVRRYAGLLRLSHDAIFVRRLGGETEFWNTGAEQLYGFSEDEALGKNVHELLKTSSAAGLGDLHEVLVREGHWEGELEHRSKDGRLVTVSAHMQVLRGEDGLERVLQSNRDITERKRAEEKLKRSRQGLSHLAEASVRVMRETNLEPMFRSISAAALELTGGRSAVTGHGYVSGHFVIGGAACAPGAPECPPDKSFTIEKGGVYLELTEGSADSIRLTDAQLRANPRWWGLPEGHIPMRGLLGVRLVDHQGRTDGMILVTDKDQGDFTAEDEALLRQLGTLASLALQHVEARVSAQDAARK